MKKTLIITSIVLIAVLIFIVVFPYLNNPSSEELEIPKNTKYTLIYSTGENETEKAHINFLNKNGKKIGENIINNIINSDGMRYNPVSNVHTVFTHDEVYFDGENEDNIINKEMKTVYKFATDDGLDEVYTSGYLDKINMTYKHIPHGLAYAQKDLGYFDLITLYNDKQIYNIRIAEGGSVVANQETATIYNFTGEEGSYISFDKIVYEKEKDDFNVIKGEIDITELINKESLVGTPFFLGKTTSLKDKLYQIIHFGEENIKTYLLEYSIDFEKNNIEYQNNYPLNLEEGETISIHTVTTINEDEIKYYLPIESNKIITFNFEKKTFDFTPFLNNIEEQDDVNSFFIKEIEDNIFILETDAEKNLFRIYEVDKKGSFKEMIESDLPKTKSFADWWVVDFYVM